MHWTEVKSFGLVLVHEECPSRPAQTRTSCRAAETQQSPRFCIRSLDNKGDCDPSIRRNVKKWYDLVKQKNVDPANFRWDIVWASPSCEIFSYANKMKRPPLERKKSRTGNRSVLIGLHQALNPRVW
jgi:hypothetical protein